MHSPVANFLEATRAGLIHPLHGHAPMWRVRAEVTPIYLAMLNEGWPNPFMDREGVAAGPVLAGELAE